ncbi:hypothetical protein A2U01_0070074, partial [Trifolium medium]|nr:hypothetical protein [Trifolium medium]
MSTPNTISPIKSDSPKSPPEAVLYSKITKAVPITTVLPEGSKKKKKSSSKKRSLHVSDSSLPSESDKKSKKKNKKSKSKSASRTPHTMHELYI